MCNRQKKILLIIPYFGELPVYFDIFLKSVENNPNLDFLFLYDGFLNKISLPSNFRYEYYTLDRFNVLASEKLGFPIAVTNGYKICDFRPLFGYFWEKILEEYDYWGSSDIDLILGNTSYFLDEIFLQENYDVVTLRDDYFAAAFFLMKNCDITRNLFKLKSGWEEVLLQKNYQGFDEFGRQWYLDNNVNKWFRKYGLPNLTTIINSAIPEVGLKVYRKKIIKESIYSDEVLMYANREITSLRTNENYFHYHYITEKSNKDLFAFPEWNIVPESFYITRAGFFEAGKYKISTIKGITKKRIIRNRVYRSSIGLIKRGFNKLKAKLS